jgi:aminoglycoside 3-N-acetyltransferase I
MAKTSPAPVVVRRLGPADLDAAQRTIRLIGHVFAAQGDEAPENVSAAYVASLLARPGFWLVAALLDGEPVGGLTAHALPMTRSESDELLIYDLAVHPGQQRRGIGRALVQALRDGGAAAGIGVAFVPADNEDQHALDFYKALGGDAAPVTIFTFE